jgi:LPS-assembly protein
VEPRRLENGDGLIIAGIKSAWQWRLVLFYCPRLMRSFPAIALLFVLAVALPCAYGADDTPGYFYEPLRTLLPGVPEGNISFDPATGTYYATNELLQYKQTVLMADSVSWNPDTGIAIASGHVRVQEGSQVWVGSQITYNFKTHMIESGRFRSGRIPVFFQGDHIQGDVTNRTYTAQRVYATTDNISQPAYYIRASRMKIVPGKYIEAWNAVVYVKGVPLFYYPYYRRNLDMHSNKMSVMPGDDSSFGPYLLGIYDWRLDDDADGRVHLDYREKRGFGAGPDLNLHLGRWGEVQAKYYYLYDHDANESVNSDTNFDNLGTVHENRQRAFLSWQATPATNLNVKALVNYQSDQLILHDFFQSDYGQNPQPNTFVEGNKYWNDWSFDALTTPRVNDFFDQVERLPDLQLTGFRQQIFNTPVYYESQSSVGYYERYFAGTNTLFGATNNTQADFEAMRADTFHQLLLPETFFGWLNVTPRVGGRATYYGPANGAGGTNAETTRFVFNTGADVSVKASQLWPDATNSILDINGLRHIIMPSISYVYVPTLNDSPQQLPQFDTQLPNLLILPVEFPDYNDIDSIDRENVLRFGIRNTLQTKRNGQLDNLLDWNVMLDWNLKPNEETNNVFLTPQKTFDDLYSDLIFKPRSWIALESQMRYDINDNHLDMSFHQLTFTPNDRWSWAVGHWYLHDGFIDTGDDVITSTLFYRLDENWGFRATHYFNVQNGHLQEQLYSVYRDLRSWTAALTVRVIDNGGGQPLDYGVALSVSLKAVPRFHLGDDTVRSYEMLGQ